MIQNSRFKIRWGCRAVCILIRVAACGVPACDDKELRASAAPRLRPADPLRDRFCLRAARNRRLSPSYFAANPTAQQSAARSRPRAEGCNLALLESRPSARLRAGPELGPVRQEQAGRSLQRPEFIILNLDFTASAKPRRPACAHFLHLQKNPRDRPFGSGDSAMVRAEKDRYEYIKRLMLPFGVLAKASL